MVVIINESVLMHNPIALLSSGCPSFVEHQCLLHAHQLVIHVLLLVLIITSSTAIASVITMSVITVIMISTIALTIINSIIITERNQTGWQLLMISDV